MFFVCLALQKFILTYVNVNGTTKSVLYTRPYPTSARQSVTDALNVPSRLASQDIDYANVFLTGRGNVSVLINSQVTLPNDGQVQFAPFFDLARGTTVQQSTIQLTLASGSGNKVAAVASFADTLTLRVTNVTLTPGQSNLSELFGVTPRVETSLTVISDVFRINTPTNPVSTQMGGLTAETATLSVKGATLTIESVRSPKAMGLCLEATSINVVNATITTELNQQYNEATHVSGLFSTVGALTIKGSTVTLTVNASEQYGGLGNTVSTSASITGSTLTITLSVGQKCIHVGALFNTTESATVIIDENTFNFNGYYTSDCTLTGDCQNVNRTVNTIEINDSSFTQSVNYSIPLNTREFKYAIESATNANNSKIVFTALNFPTNTSFSPFNVCPLYSNILVQTSNQLNVTSGGNYPFYGTIAPFLTEETCIIKVQDETNFNFSDTHVGGIIAAIYNTNQNPIKIVNCTMGNTLTGKEMSALTHQLTQNSHVTIQNCSFRGTVTSTQYSTIIVRTGENVTLSITNFTASGPLNVTGATGFSAVIGEIRANSNVEINYLTVQASILQQNAPMASGISSVVYNNVRITIQHSQISGEVRSNNNTTAGIASTVNNNANIVIINITIDSWIASTISLSGGLFGQVSQNSVISLTSASITNKIMSRNLTGSVAALVQQNVSITINNLTITSQLVSNQNMSGGVVAQLANNSNITISRGSIAPRVEVNSNNIAGGIIGKFEGNDKLEISDLSIGVRITNGSSRVAGVLSHLQTGSLTLQRVTGNVTITTTSGDSIGGIVGIVFESGTINIQELELTATITTSGKKSAGLIAEIHALVSTSVSIVGTVLQVTINGNNNNDDARVGGVIGTARNNSFTMDNCSFTVALAGGQRQGGLLSYNEGAISLNMNNITMRFTGNGPSQYSNGTGAVIGESAQKPTGTQTNVTVTTSGTFSGCPNGNVTSDDKKLQSASAKGGQGIYCEAARTSE